LLAHEDKIYEGALIASLSIPWGEAKSDDDLGGYHLVWTRDMCNSATGLMAAGDTTTPLRALVYLACTQRPDGGFYQNFWINGEAYWQGIQLDEGGVPDRAGLAAARSQGPARFSSLAHGSPGGVLFSSHNGPATRRNAGKRKAATRPRLWRPTSRA